MKQLLRTNNPAELTFAIALMNGQGITVFPLDVHMSILEGSVGVLPRRLMVADRDHARARAILHDNGFACDD